MELSLVSALLCTSFFSILLSNKRYMMQGKYITAINKNNTPVHTLVLSEIIQKLGLKTIRRIPIANATTVIKPKHSSSLYVDLSFLVKIFFIKDTSSLSKHLKAFLLDHNIYSYLVSCIQPGHFSPLSFEEYAPILGYLYIVDLL